MYIGYFVKSNAIQCALQLNKFRKYNKESDYREADLLSVQESLLIFVNITSNPSPVVNVCTVCNFIVPIFHYNVAHWLLLPCAFEF